MLLPVSYTLHIVMFYYTKRLLTKQGEFCALTKQHNNPA